MAEADEVSVDELKKIAQDADDVDSNYKAPAKVDLATIQQMDADDESLKKYKENLLGAVTDVQDEGGPNVIVKRLTIDIQDKTPIELDLTGDLSKLKNNVIKLPEGCSYRLIIGFRVQRDIVSGLRFMNKVSRKGIKVDSNTYMVGSYGPKTEIQEYKTPLEEAPKGLISRGTYQAKSKFTDDDKNSILEWDWWFDICKK